MPTNKLNKLTNLFVVFGSYLLSLIFRKDLLQGKPIILSVEPVNFCNLHCPECPVGNKSVRRGMFSIQYNIFRKLIERIKHHTLYLTLYFQGEPFLHSDFPKLVAVARENGLYTASSTNAQSIDCETAKQTVLSGLNKLIISIDGTTQEVYEKYRVGGSLKKTIAAIKHLVYWKKQLHSQTPLIELQFLVFRHNEHQIADIKLLSKQLGADKLTLKTAQIADYKHGSSMMPLQEKFSRYRQSSDGSFYRKKKLHNRCRRAFCGAVITATGDVLPCSYDKQSEYVFGNINEEPLHEIWHNEKARRFRKQILADRSVFPMCRNCTE
ncbi:MAG: radical SAM protein [Prevotellaceae bacterium]|jgi:radical SAM protein with 4Fe4S-binding SPASM domain|nr:radical SAM protein [Prevotellaceae bacterium]